MKAVILIAAFSCATATSSFGWGLATHAHITDQTGTNDSLHKYNEIYGALGRDFFLDDDSLFHPDNGFVKYMNFGSVMYGFPSMENFWDVWKAAEGSVQKAAAFGVVLNNNIWGVDIIANKSGIIYGKYVGYAAQKADDLVEIFDKLGVWKLVGLNPDVPEQFKICKNICHESIDFAGDIIITRKDPAIGRKIKQSASVRTPAFPGLITEAAGTRYTDYIMKYEQAWRERMKWYGDALSSGESEAMKASATIIAERLNGRAEVAGRPAIPDLHKGFKNLYPTILKLIENDFLPEIEATLVYAKKIINEHNLKYEISAGLGRKQNAQYDDNFWNIFSNGQLKEGALLFDLNGKKVLNFNERHAGKFIIRDGLPVRSPK